MKLLTRWICSILAATDSSRWIDAGSILCRRVAQEGTCMLWFLPIVPSPASDTDDDDDDDDDDGPPIAVAATEAVVFVSHLTARMTPYMNLCSRYHCIYSTAVLSSSSSIWSDSTTAKGLRSDIRLNGALNRLSRKRFVESWSFTFTPSFDARRRVNRIDRHLAALDPANDSSLIQVLVDWVAATNLLYRCRESW